MSKPEVEYTGRPPTGGRINGADTGSSGAFSAVRSCETCPREEICSEDVGAVTLAVIGADSGDRVLGVGPLELDGLLVAGGGWYGGMTNACDSEESLWRIEHLFKCEYMRKKLGM